MNIPADAPAPKFGSVVLYDKQTRSELQTDQTFPSQQSQRDKTIAKVDGSIELYFGPEAPAGMDANWVQTVPGKGWFLLLRLYSPTEAWFDKARQPGNVVLVYGPTPLNTQRSVAKLAANLVSEFREI